ncbi:MAG: hypothetical protein K2K97_03035 [Muribaculaceae bacterium]|nr:hypothetical protein [Muribaculaceae bacterium]
MQQFDLAKFRYKVESPSVFHNNNAKEIERINAMISPATRAASIENPAPSITLPASNIMGSIDAPNGELWYYTGEFDYLEIPPHDNVWFTDRILQEYSFTIYNSKMEIIGTIKDKMDYAENEVRVVLCEITPVATRNFFNTDNNIELIVALGVNIEGGGNNYRSLIYALNGEKDAEGFDKVIDVMDDLVGDVVEGPSTDGSDNFYITFMSDVFDYTEDVNNSFWTFLLAQKAEITVYGKAIDNNGPRKIFNKIIPVIQLPGDQQDVPALISLRRGDEVIYCISEYKEPFYNRYDDPMSEEMTQREGNSLIINLYKASENGLDVFSTTEIPVVLDPMKDSEGNPTCLFSYYSVGNLGHRDDILFDAPGVEPNKPDFIITRGNYQTSTDGITNSYFTYKNDGSLKNTLFVYAAATKAMGDIEGFEPQQMFVSQDAYGYIYNFVDLYSGKVAAKIDANYYYDDDSDSELLTVNMDRTPVGDTYRYVFELRYPLVDDNENDILRFMYINRDGTYDHTEYVNMGKGVAYAQSYISTEALAAHAYSTSNTPAFMMLVKRGVEESEAMIEELMVAEAISEENPDGKTLLQVGPDDKGGLASIVPEFAQGNQPSRLLVYYYNSENSKYSLDIYRLPFNEDSGVENIGEDKPQISIDGSCIISNGEIKVFTLDGKLVACGLNSVEFSSLSSRLYIVTAGGKSYKVIK